MINMWMDVVVDLANIWEKCAIDYFMQALGKSVTSLPGALDFVTNFMFRLFDDGEVELYTALDTALIAQDKAGVGLYIGIFLKRLFVLEIPAETESLFNDLIESVRSD